MELTISVQFGNETPLGTYEVTVPGVADSEEMNVEDGFHSMK